MEERLNFKLKQFKTAVADFEASLSIDVSKLELLVADSVKSGRAQKYEFCTELMWKVIKVFINDIHGIDVNSPKSVLKEFYLLEYVSAAEYESIVEMLVDRNRLSHVYSKEQFETIYNKLIKTLPLFTKIIDKIDN